MQAFFNFSLPAVPLAIFRLKITVKGTLAASGQSTISAKRAVTLKR